MKGDKLGELAVRIAQISDTHITKFGMHIPEFLDSCIRIINSLDPAPDIVIHTGDLTDNGVLLDYELAVEKMEEVEPDILYLPGNHDERNYGDSLFREMVSKTDVLNSFKKVAVLVLDSAIPDTDNGRLGRWRRELLKTSFQAFSENVLKVVAFHHRRGQACSFFPCIFHTAKRPDDNPLYHDKNNTRYQDSRFRLLIPARQNDTPPC
jgi:Icc protein